MICSKSYDTHSKMLADEIATQAKRLATGVGECLRRIIGKTITGLLKEDIIHAVGTLQTCAGLESGIDSKQQYML